MYISALPACVYVYQVSASGGKERVSDALELVTGGYVMHMVLRTKRSFSAEAANAFSS